MWARLPNNVGSRQFTSGASWRGRAVETHSGRGQLAGLAVLVLLYDRMPSPETNAGLALRDWAICAEIEHEYTFGGRTQSNRLLQLILSLKKAQITRGDQPWNPTEVSVSQVN